MFVVVVLYRQLPSESDTVATLHAALQRAEAIDCTILLYDNSPVGEDVVMPEGFRYEAAAANRGMYGAYEAAMRAVHAEGCDWLLTLDQDTSLPVDFFSAIQPGLDAAAVDPKIAAIVPHLAEGTVRLSPAYVGMVRTTPLPSDFSGVPSREARAFNSAALLRVAAIDSIGGFDPCFWLDHVDSWLHHELFLHGWRMYVLKSVHIEHELSLLNYKKRMTPERFVNFLWAEAAYFDLYCSATAGIAYTAWLVLRLFSQMRRREAQVIRQATWSALLRRITMRRRERIARWREAMGCASGRPASSAGK